MASAHEYILLYYYDFNTYFGIYQIKVLVYMCVFHAACILLSVYVGGFGAWDGSNCRVLRETDEEVECGCDHLTHFAILLVSNSIQGVCTPIAFIAVFRSYLS